MCERKILRNTLAFVIHHSKAGLRKRHSLVSELGSVLQAVQRALADQHAATAGSRSGSLKPLNVEETGTGNHNPGQPSNRVLLGSRRKVPGGHPSVASRHKIE